MFNKDIGIDLGTANTLIYMRDKGIVMREPTVVAIDAKSGFVRFVGTEAKDVIGRTPGSIVAVRPLKDGVIADFASTAQMLQIFIRKVLPSRFGSKPNIVICIPSGVTAVERRAVKDAAYKAGGKNVMLIEEPLAAAIGAGLPIAEAVGSMVVDIGGGTTEVAVISLGGIVASRSIRIGGDAFDTAILNYIKKTYNLLIGERTAEEIKVAIASAFELPEELRYTVHGRNLLDGLPKSVEICDTEIRQALLDSIYMIIEAVKLTLEKTPPELAADIYDNGITLTGGGALLRGLPELITKETMISVHIAENPLECVAIGTGKTLDNLDVLRDSIDDE